MPDHVITFHGNGAIEFTRNPVVESLFEGDRKRIERMTDIRFDEKTQRHYIVFLKGPPCIAGRTLYRTDNGDNQMRLLWDSFSRQCDPALMKLIKMDGWLVTFGAYEDAVKVEVAFVDFLRLQGFSMK